MARPVEVRLDVIEWLSDDQPGFVRCRMIDWHGREWLFDEKVPVVSAVHFGPGDIPLSVWIAATATSVPDADFLSVTLAHGIEATDGTTSFKLGADLVRALE